MNTATVSQERSYIRFDDLDYGTWMLMINKKRVYVIIALTLSSCLLIGASMNSAFSVLVDKSYVLSSTGVILSSTPEPTSTPLNQGTINKASVIYGRSWSSADISYAASTSTCSSWTSKETKTANPYGQWMQSVKSQNPSMLIFGYKILIGEYSIEDDWATVNAHENWFVHDAKGNRIKDSIWGHYLMDVGNVGWREHWVSYVNSKMAAFPAYDGVYADVVWDTLMTSEVRQHGPSFSRE